MIQPCPYVRTRNKDYEKCRHREDRIEQENAPSDADGLKRQPIPASDYDDEQHNRRNMKREAGERPSRILAKSQPFEQCNEAFVEGLRR